MSIPSQESTVDRLKEHAQWICYNADKMPYNPHTGYGADCNNPETWTTFSEAMQVYQSNSNKYKGVGFEFVKEQGITGVDLDKCIDDEGNFSPFAQEVVRRLNSYTEYSPSGKGLHIWVRGNIPNNIGPNPKLDGNQRIEAYDCLKYFTVTEKHLPGTSETIEDRQEELTALFNEITARRLAAKKAAKVPQQRATNPETVNTLYGLKALSAECHEVATMPEGGRNDRLNQAAYSLGQLVGGGELLRETVERKLTTAAEDAGLGSREIERTIKSGLEDGMKQPRNSPVNEIIYGADGGNGNTSSKPAGVGESDGPEIQFILDRLDEGEYGDSILFARLFRGKVLYDLTAQEWYKWAGHWWELDEEGSIKHLVSGRLASLYLQTGAALNTFASQIEARADLSGEDEQKTVAVERAKKAREQIKQLHARAFALRQISRCKNVLAFAQSHAGMSLVGKNWDRDTWLLAVPNGVLDLRTGILREGKPEDYIRTICPTEWRGINTPAPRWARFLHEIFEDREEVQRFELINFLQRLLGYGITGEVVEHVFTVFYGEEGRNGKDTLQLALSSTLGAVSGAISKDVLLEAGRHAAGAPTPHLSDLQGRRLAWANEPERGARFSVGQVKDLSGGGEIPTRGLHEKKITKLQPTHLLILLTNHKPHADASDSAFWDRLRLITFNMRFVDNPQAPNERKKDTTLWSQLKGEAPGILAWLVRGCLEWQQTGLTTPEQVLSSVSAYRKEEDILDMFFDEICVIHTNATVKASELYNAYKQWSDDGTLYKLNSKLFGLELAKKKIEKKKTRNGIIYQGIGLLDTNPSEECEGLQTDYSHTIHTAPDAASHAIDIANCEQCEQWTQVFTKNPIYIGQNYEKPASTIHTVHSQQVDNRLNRLVEPSQSSVNSQNDPSHTVHSQSCDKHPNRPAIDAHKRCEECHKKFLASLAEPEDNTLPEVNPFYREAGEDYEEGYI